MPISETARALALRILASYPGWPVSEMNVLAIGDVLDRIGLDIAETVTEMARHGYEKPPSVAQLYEVARDIRADAAEVKERYALAPAEVLPAMPPEVRERILAMHEKWAQIDDEVEVDRDAEWQQKMAASRASGSLASIKACAGAGQIPVERDGKLVCPDCGVEVPDQIVRLPKRKEFA